MYGSLSLSLVTTSRTFCRSSLGGCLLDDEVWHTITLTTIIGPLGLMDGALSHYDYRHYYWPDRPWRLAQGPRSVPYYRLKKL
ncbi:hypothetical protein FOCC_FOCC012340 [Frankliniella occidentalis]|nr:hypothetical protein FOCC_FOCC012340 [Frankliniella occidentalis]